MTSAPPALATNPDGFRREVSVPGGPRRAGTCDCHLHIVGPISRYPFVPEAKLRPPEATLDDYRAMAGTVGVDRMVVVQPSFYGTDNRCTLDAVERMGGAARAVVVIDPEVPEDDLLRMHRAGARGVRVNLVSHGGPPIDRLARIAERIRPMGWHLQVFIDGRRLPRLAPMLRQLSLPLVFDHLAQVEPQADLDDEGLPILCRWLEEGFAWTKISAFRFPLSIRRARRLLAANPRRVLWGTDWPHVAYEHHVPDDGRLLDQLADCAGDDDVVRRVLVDNPDVLYFRDSIPAGLAA